MEKYLKIVFCGLFLIWSVGSWGAKKYKLIEIETNLGFLKVRLYENTPKHSENFLKLVQEKHYDSLLFHRVIKDFMIQGGASDSKRAPEGQLIGISDPGYTIEAEIRPENYHVKGAIAAARQGDDVNPERKSSGEQFYLVQGRVYTDPELDQIEKRKLWTAKNRLGADLYKKVSEEHKRFLLSGQKNKADSLINEINAEIEKKFAGKNPYQISPEARMLYKTVGGCPFLDGDYTVFGEVVEGIDILDRIANVETDKNDRPLKEVVILGMKLKRK